MATLSALRFHLSRVSTNSKTGPIPVSTSSAVTCPPSCPFNQGGGMLCRQLPNETPLGCGDPWRPWRAAAAILGQHRRPAYRSTVAPQSSGRPAPQCRQNLSPIYPGDHLRKQRPPGLHVHPSQSGHQGESSPIASGKPPRVHGQPIDRIGICRRFCHRIRPACRADCAIGRDTHNMANGRRESRSSLSRPTVRH